MPDPLRRGGQGRVARPVGQGTLGWPEAQREKRGPRRQRGEKGEDDGRLPQASPASASRASVSSASAKRP